MCSLDSKPVFRDLSADDPDPEVTEIESLCMNCHSNGITRLLLTRIPHYKNVVIMSFSCEECGYANNEIQPGGAYAELGVRWKLKVETRADMNRQVVKSDHTCVRIPHLELEIPAQSQRGEVTTVEGVIQRALNGLSQEQETRRREHPEDAQRIDHFLTKLQGLQDVEAHGPFLMEIEDISGNCFVENPETPKRDPRCSREDFRRSQEQDHALGIFTHDESSSSGLLRSADPTSLSLSGEVLVFPTNCPECNAPADTNMKLTDIPHFKRVVIMATVCDHCGHRTNEVKAGGGVEDRGVRFQVRVNSREDFNRDILKAETCALRIPELELEVGGRALGGRFTTMEGVLRATGDQLREMTGDAPVPRPLVSVLCGLEEVLEGVREVTVVLDDPAGNSYVQSLAEEEGQLDHKLEVFHYERSFEQNEELGLNDMKTEGYQDDS